MYNILLILVLFSLNVFASTIVGATKGEFNVSSGTATYNLEIVTPKGIAGLKPSLSINYNSSNNFNGILGVGFSLGGISSINKCNQKLFKEKKDSSRNYNYCLDGQKLVLKNLSDIYGNSNTEYRTHIDSYSKIIKDSSGWIVYSKDGLIYEYGKTSTSKDSTVFYRVNKIKDRYNNEINFIYDTTTKTLQKITYSDNTIDFIYENRDDKKVLYTNGVKIDLSKRLKSISVKTNNTEISSYDLKYDFINNISILKSISETIGGKSLKPIVFSWDNNISTGFSNNELWFTDNNASLTSWEITTGDMNGDGLNDLIRTYKGSAGHKFVVSLNNGNGFEPPKIWLSNSAFNSSKWNIKAQDMNGDGLLDIVQTYIGRYGRKFIVSLNNGNSGVYSSKLWFYNKYHTLDGQDNNGETFQEYTGTQIYAQDINADGLADLIQKYDGYKKCKIMVSLNNGNGFNSEETLFEDKNLVYMSSDISILFQDMNGDGLIDLVKTIRNQSLVVSINNGNGFNSFRPWLSSSWTLYKQDVNGDGLLDGIEVYKGTSGHKLKISLNNGNGFDPAKIWFIDTDSSLSTWNIYTQDMNGDGLADLVQSYKGTSGHKLKISLNNGNGFDLAKIWFIDTDSSLSTWKIYVQDMNADGLSDLVQSYKGPEGHKFKVSLNNGTRLQLTKITNHQDQEININYSTLRDSDVYTSTTDLSYPNQEIKSSPMKVVKSFTSMNGIGGLNKVSYKYKNLAFNYERGSLGFEEVTTLDETTNSKSIVKYNQTFPLLGTVKESNSYINNKLISKSINEYQSVTYGNDKTLRYQLHNNKSTSYTYDYDTSTELSKKEVIKSNIDSYGNVGKVITKTIGNNITIEKEVTNTYTNDESAWILSRLANASVLHKKTSQNDILRTSEFEYDAGTGTLIKEIIEPNNSKALTKVYTYTSKGNKKTETISAQGVPSRTTTYTYDSYGKNIIKIKNPLGHTKEIIYALNNQPWIIIGANKLSKIILYDEMNRKVSESNINGTITTWEYTWTNTGHKVIQKINDKFPTTVYFDKVGRKIKTQKIGFDGKNIYETIKYNNKGLKTEVSSPFFENEDPEYIYYTYDAANRLTQTNSPAPNNQRAITTLEFNPYSTIKTDAMGEQKTTIVDVSQKVIKIDDGSTIEYTYDAIGNLINTQDANGNNIKLTYDILGNKIKQIDPDMGTWTYNYNALKQLVSQTDAKNQTTTFTYDILGRILKKTIPEGVINFQYDIGNKAIGKITKEVGIGNSKEYTYDNFGRLKNVTTKMDDQVYLKQYTYDSLGRLDKTIEPNNIEIENNYNENGYLESITSPKDVSENVNVEQVTKDLILAMEESLKYKKLELEYKKQIIGYKAKLIRYRNIVDIYDNPRKHSRSNRKGILHLLKYFSHGLSNFIDNLEVLSRKYQELSPVIDNETFLNHILLTRQHRNFSEELQNEGLYLLEQAVSVWSGSRYALAAIASDSLSMYEELLSGNTILYTGNMDEIYNFYSEGLLELQDEVTYIKNLKEKENNNKILKESYAKEGSRLFELLKSNKIYFYKVLQQNSAGVTTSYLSGNGLETNTKYDTSGALTNITTSFESNSSEIRDLSFQYDKVHNVLNRNDTILEVEQDYIYDSLHRLKYANIITIDNTNVLSYNYDGIGNMTSKSDIGNYSYNSSKPHAVMNILKRDDAGNIIVNKSFEYDANGNMTQNVNKTITYTSFNKPNRIQKGTTDVKFFYDANNSRYKKKSNSDTTHYVGKTYEKNFYGNGVSEDKYFIYANGKIVSIFKNRSNQYSVKFLHYDNLGSIDTITNSQGLVESRMAYKPFGEQLNLDKYGNETTIASNVTNRGYTGHEHIKEVGLIHMNGRVYDATIARFLSADPHIQAPHDSQSYNRYTYVRNNPLKYTDPSGYSFWSKKWKKIKRWIKPILSIVVAIVIAVYAGPMIGQWVAGWGTSFGTAAGMGTLTTTSLGGVIAGGITGALAGGIAGIVGARLNGASWSNSFKFGLKSALAGAISGSVMGYYGKVWSGGRVISQSLAGGAGSEIMGGEFKDGFKVAFITAGARYIYNKVVKYDTTWESGGDAVSKKSDSIPVEGANNIGTAGKLSDNINSNFGEGGYVSNITNKIYGLNATAGMHDVMQVYFDKIQGSSDGWLRMIGNIPAMIPAAAISYTALLSDQSMVLTQIREIRKRY